MTSQSTKTFLDLTDAEFLAKLQSYARFKTRSRDTHHSTHVPELNLRLRLNAEIVSPQQQAPSGDASQQNVPGPNLTSTSPIHAVLLGNSMLERFKTTGLPISLCSLSTAFNVGVGGDKNENVIYQLTQGLYITLKSSHSDPENKFCDIKLWVLASGTNNFHPKSQRAFTQKDVESWKLLLQVCLRMAPGSGVVACDVGFRSDVEDAVVEGSNAMLEKVVGEVNRELKERGEER
jgi:hypothetical protein